MNNLKVSVVIPVYKVESYLDRCVESIVSQIYQNLEIILVDDGSPDKCPEMCDAWAQKDSRIKVVHKKNGGLGDARNAGLDVATGDLIGFVDSDDWCEPSMYQRMVDSYNEHRKPIVVCDVWVDWENGWPSEKKCMGGSAFVWNRVEAAEAFFSDDLPAWMCNKLFEKSLWDGNRFKSQLYEDIPVMRHLVSFISGVSFTHTLEYHYIQQQKSIVNSCVKEKHLTLLYETIENYEAAKHVSSKVATCAQREVVRVAYSLLYKLVVQGELLERQCEIAEIIRQNGDVVNDIALSNALDRIIVKKIANGRRYKYLIKGLSVLKKLYFKLKIKEIIGKKR